MDEPVGQAQIPETMVNPELQVVLATAVPFMEQTEVPTAQA
jgi:hypothetical protein